MHSSNLPSAPSPALTTAPRPDVLVVGGGLVGLFCADSLAARGLKVELWERRAPQDRSPQDHSPQDHSIQSPEQRSSVGNRELGVASWASAGMLAPLAEVPDDPSFLSVCLAARDLWREVAPELEETSGCRLDYDATGALLVDHPDAPIARFEAAANQAGEPAFRLGADEAKTLVPDLAPTAGPLLFLPEEHRVDNRQVCHALRRRLRQRGVALHDGRQVMKLREKTGGVSVAWQNGELEAGTVVVAAGAWSSQVDGLPPIPVHPVKGQMLHFENVEWPLTGCFRGGHFYAARRLGPDRNGLLLGATVEPEAGFDVDVTGGGLESLLAFARKVLPGLLARPVVDSWAGLRPGSPDGRPLIGQLGERLWIASGHYRNGVLLAPWTARLIADWWLAGAPPCAAEATLFSPQRVGQLSGVT